MYSTCLFCSGALGRNEAIEHFPVGRRLAFDAAKGRLWVVCKSCARWNLTPLESRWEAIEEAERAYRDTKLRASTPNVGLAKLKDGTELVRIGSPMLPEFAAWRYGDIFRRRRLRGLATGALLIGVPVVISGARLLEMSSGVVLVAGGGSLYSIYNLGQIAHSIWKSQHVRANLFDDDGERMRVTTSDAQRSEVLIRPGDETWGLRVVHRQVAEAGPLLRRLGLRSRQRFKSHYSTLEGHAARRALTRLLPLINAKGDSASGVASAVEMVGALETPERVLSSKSTPGHKPSVHIGPNLLAYLPANARLAMEMMLHESDERRAMEGELAELEARWKEAEEIASIADNMFLPLSVSDRVDGLKREAIERDD